MRSRGKHANWGHSALALEPRLLFDASVAAAVASAVVPQADAHHDQPDPAPDHPVTDAPAAAPAQDSAQGRTLVVIDARVAGQTPPTAPGAEMVVIQAGEDGAKTILQALESGGPVSSLQIIAHGGEGSLHLGDLTLNDSSLNGAEAATVSAWAPHLTQNADILLYSCSTGAGAGGAQFIGDLAHLTGADVAASTNLTGAAELGGDWLLETSTGSIESTLALSADSVAAIDHVLAAPVLTDTATATREVLKSGTLTISGLSVGDVDGDSLTLAIDVDHGSLTLPNAATAGLSQLTHSGNWVLTGTAAQINSALADMTFDPGSYAGTAHILMDLSDNPAGGGGVTVNSTIDIVCNSAPTVSDSVGGPRTPIQNTDFAITGVTVADTDGDSLTTTVSVGHGTITLASQNHLTVTGDGTGTVTLVGSAADINAALNGMTYHGSSGYAGSDTLSVTVNDGKAGGSVTLGSGAALNVDSAPTVAGTSAATVTAIAGGDTTITSIVISDADLGGGTVTVDLTVTNGTISLHSTSGLSGLTGNNSATLHFTGTLADVNNALNGMIYHASGSYTGAASLSVVVTDGVATTTATNTSFFTVAKPPSWTDSATTTRSVAEDTNLSVTGITVADADSASLTVDLTAGHGTITLHQTTGLTGLTGDGTGTVHFTGTLANINAALAGLLYKGSANYNGSDSITFQAADTLSTITKTINVSVTPVNDAPTMSPTSTSVAEGGSITFTNTHLGLSDVDNQDVQIIIKVTQLPGKGTLYLNGGPVVVGSTLSLDDLKAGALSYTHDGTQTTSVGGTGDLFKVSVEDGAGGSVASTSVTLTITAVNQAPAVSGTTNVYEGETNKAVTVTITDGDQTGAYTVEILSLPADGVLKLNGTAVTIGQTFSSTQLGLLTYTHDGNDSNLGHPPSTSFQVRVTDDGGGTATQASTTATINLNVVANDDDPVLATNTGLTLDHVTGGIFYLGTNGANGCLKITDVDSPDVKLTYTVTQATDPSIGRLQRWNSGTGTWQNLGIGGTFTQWDIANGNVRYNYGAASQGTYTDAFHFTVTDSATRAYPSSRAGGIYDSGTNTLTDHVFTINISATTTTGGGGTGGTDHNGTTPPSISGGTLSLSEGDTNVALSSGIVTTAATTGTDAQIVYTLTALPGYGTLTKNGTALGLYDSFTKADLAAGIVKYSHDGSEHFTLSFAVTVKDNGAFLGEATCAIDVTPVNDAPTVTINAPHPQVAEGGNKVITNTTIGLADVDGSGDKSGTGYATINALSFKVTALPAHGQLELDTDGNGTFETVVDTSTVITSAQLAAGRFRYVHDGGESASDTFNVQAVDDSGAGNDTSTVKTVTIDVAKLNDAPSQTENVGLVVDEDGTGIILGFGANGGTARMIWDDPDNTNVQRQFQLATNVAYGKLQLFTGGAWQTLGINSVFTQADLNAGNLRYVNTSHTSHTDGFTFNVRDGAATPVAGSYSIQIRPVNEAPTITVGTTSLVNTTGTHTFTGNLTVGDADYGDTSAVIDDMQVSIAATKGGSGFGTLHIDAATGVTVVSGNDSDTVVIHGTKAQLNAALAAMTYSYAGDPDAAVSIAVQVNDLANGGTAVTTPVQGIGGALTASAAITLYCSTANDAPGIVTAATATVAEDTNLTFGNGSIALSDVDGFTGTERLTLSVAHGTLTLASTTGLTFNNSTANGGATIDVTGTLANLQAALNGLKYKGTVDYNNDQGGTPDTLTIGLSDGGNYGPGGTQTAGATVDITVTAVNDTPTVGLTDTSAINLAAGTQSPIGFTGDHTFTVGDIKDTGQTGATDLMTVTITSKVNGTAYGTMHVDATIAGLIVDSGNDSATVVMTGTKAVLDAALAGMTFTPADYNAKAVATITVAVNDLGNTGTGGALTASKSVDVNLSNANAAPGITRPASASVNEDSYVNLSNNAVAITDADAFGAAETVTLSVAHGVLKLQSTSNLTFTAGADNSSTMTITGTLNAINSAIRTLKYTPTGNWFGTDVLTITVNDQGHTGGIAQTTTGTVNITVNAVNDAPFASGTVAVSTTEDSASTGETVASLMGRGTVAYADSIDNQTANGGGDSHTALAGIAVIGNAATAAQGKWQFNTGGGWVDIPTSGLSASAALVLDATTQVRFSPAANWNGTPGALTVKLSDGNGGLSASSSAADLKNISAAVGGTGQWSQYSSGTTGSGTATITASVAAANDAPTASGSITLAATTEDHAGPAGDTVANLIGGGNYADTTDTVTGGSTASALAGIAIVGNAETGAHGHWQYKLAGGSWTNLPTILSDSSAVVLSTTASLRFLPDVADWNGTPGALTIRLSDGTGFGGNATGVDLGTVGGTSGWSNTISFGTSVNAVNDTPTTSGTYTFAISEDNSSGARTVATVLAGHYDDSRDDVTNGSSHTNLAGIAVIANAQTDATQGKWQYNTGGGWADVPTSGLSASAAFVLSTSAQLKFVPAANWNGTPGDLTVLVSDGAGFTASTSHTNLLNVTANQGASGTHGWSTATFAVKAAVGAVNDAPVVSGETTLPQVAFGAPNPGNSVASLIDTSTHPLVSYTDATDDQTAKGGSDATHAPVGIAITTNLATDPAKGAWQYSTDGGTTWTDVPTAVSAGNALVLDTNAKLRFSPADGWIGIPGVLKAHISDGTGFAAGNGVDLSSSLGGTNGWSAGTIDIGTAVNHAPVVTGTATLLATAEDTANPPGDTIANLAGQLTYNDSADDMSGSGGPDNSTSQTAAIAIVGNAATAGQGSWQFKLDGGAWTNLPGGLNDSHALVLPPNALLRFVPAGDWNGTPGALTVRASDGTELVTSTGPADLKNISAVTGGSGGWSQATQTIATSVSAVNDAPTILTGTDPVLEGTQGGPTKPITVADLAGTRYSDAIDDVAGGSSHTSLAGIAITGNHALPREGRWQYSTDGGTTWVDIPTDVSVTNAVVLAPDAKLRFSGQGVGFSGQPGKLDYHVSDGTAFVAGASVNIAANIGTVHGYSVSTASLEAKMAALPKDTLSPPPPAPPPPPPPKPTPDPVPPSKPLPPVTIPTLPGGEGGDGGRGGRTGGTFDTPSPDARSNLNNSDFVSSFKSGSINPVQLALALQDQVLSGEGMQGFGIPNSAFRHTDPATPIEKEASKPDGSPLPSFIQFNKKTGQFQVDTVSAKKSGLDVLDIKVTGRDPQGNEASAVFRVMLNKQSAAEGGQGQQQRTGMDVPDEAAPEQVANVEPFVGKPALSEQLAQAGRTGFEQAARDFVEALMKLSA